MLWGHRNDPVNFHRCLQDFDRRLPDLLEALRPGDLLDPHVRPRLRPDDALDRPLARARAAARVRRRAERRRADLRGRVRRRRRDRERVARREVARPRDTRSADPDSVSRTNDPEVVRNEYADESGLAVRAAAWKNATGPNARAMAFDAVAEARPARVLEVGCGRGELAARIREELGAEVVAVDQSERMVELTRERGVTAMVADVQELPFDGGSFDCAVAAWMLYHVPDVDRAIGELARVLRRSGRLVAVTNGDRRPCASSGACSVGAPPRRASSPSRTRSRCSGATLRGSSAATPTGRSRSRTGRRRTSTSPTR